MPPPPFPDTPETRADMADFKAAARVMDDAYGRVLAALDESGLADNTLVFCFSDHGLQFPLHMCNLTDRGLAVYLIVRGPGGFGGGRVVDALVSLIDLVPTAYVAAGIEPPAFVQGQPLQPLIHGETDALHAEIFGEVTFHAAYEPMRCVRTDRYKYIQRYDGRTKPVLPNVDDTPSKQFLLDHDWPSQPRYQEMLYDLLFDPHEAHNLIDQPIYSDILSDLRTRLERWMIETNDPLLPDGQIDPPPGARYNDVNGLSPREPVV
ncbi:MAG: sulfatase-like hydrolase/transferase [Caldilineaceae bacterium]|nr:sulfatase-like hydrolase/transferase [Caldilineaceae bacterium]